MKIITFSLLLFLSANSFAQTKSYETIKIANWTLEKFPKHYLIKAAKVYTEKQPFTNKLTYYQELNEYGEAEGLTVTIQRGDYTSPSTIYYYRKGATVYEASFFSYSTKASDIKNKNLKEELDGPQIHREIDENHKLHEVISIWKNGEDLKANVEYAKQRNIHFNKDSLLDGQFSFNYVCERGEKAFLYQCWGSAHNGLVDSIIRMIDYNTPVEPYHSSDFFTNSLGLDDNPDFESYKYVIRNDTVFTYRKKADDKDFKFMYPEKIKRTIKVSCSKSYCEKNKLSILFRREHHYLTETKERPSLESLLSDMTDYDQKGIYND